MELADYRIWRSQVPWGFMFPSFFPTSRQNQIATPGSECPCSGLKCQRPSRKLRTKHLERFSGFNKCVLYGSGIEVGASHRLAKTLIHYHPQQTFKAPPKCLVKVIVQKYWNLVSCHLFPRKHWLGRAMTHRRAWQMPNSQKRHPSVRTISLMRMETKYLRRHQPTEYSSNMKHVFPCISWMWGHGCAQIWFS